MNWELGLPLASLRPSQTLGTGQAAFYSLSRYLMSSKSGDRDVQAKQIKEQLTSQAMMKREGSMKLMLGILGVSLVFSSAARAGAYTCAFETNQTVIEQCSIDSASPSTARCSFPFPGTNLTGVCVVTPLGPDDMLACQIGVLSAELAASELQGKLSSVAESKTLPAAIRALAQLPGFASAAVTVAPASKATIHLGYVEKQGSTLFSAICPSTFGKM